MAAGFRFYLLRCNVMSEGQDDGEIGNEKKKVNIEWLGNGQTNNSHAAR